MELGVRAEGQYLAGDISVGVLQVYCIVKIWYDSRGLCAEQSVSKVIRVYSPRVIGRRVLW